MEYPNNIHLQNLEDSEEALSSSCAQPPESFEFLFNNTTSSDNNIIMCSAEDIIISGKLVPSFKQNSDRQYSSFSSSCHHNHHPMKTVYGDDEKKQRDFRRRSQSSPELESSEKRSNYCSTKTKLVRNSRSLDYRKPHRSSNYPMVSPELETELLRNLSLNSSVGKSQVHLKKATKQRRSFLMFGLVKVPAEMELSDIKNRQLQRTPSPAPFPQVNQRSVKGPWKLLNALSCKDLASVAVTASLCAPPSCATLAFVSDYV